MVVTLQPGVPANVSSMPVTTTSALTAFNSAVPAVTGGNAFANSSGANFFARSPFGKAVIYALLLPVAPLLGVGGGGSIHVADPEVEKREQATSAAASGISAVSYVRWWPPSPSTWAGNSFFRKAEKKIETRQYTEAIAAYDNAIAWYERVSPGGVGQSQAMKAQAIMVGFKTKDLQYSAQRALREIRDAHRAAHEAYLKAGDTVNAGNVMTLYREAVRTFCTRESFGEQLGEIRSIQDKMSEQEIDSFVQKLLVSYVALSFEDLDKYEQSTYPGYLPLQYIMRGLRAIGRGDIANRFEDMSVVFDRMYVTQWVLMHFPGESRKEIERAELAIREAATNRDFRHKYVEDGIVSRAGMDRVLNMLFAVDDSLKGLPSGVEEEEVTDVASENEGRLNRGTVALGLWRGKEQDEMCRRVISIATVASFPKGNFDAKGFITGQGIRTALGTLIADLIKLDPTLTDITVPAHVGSLYDRQEDHIKPVKGQNPSDAVWNCLEGEVVRIQGWAEMARTRKDMLVRRVGRFLGDERRAAQEALRKGAENVTPLTLERKNEREFHVDVRRMLDIVQKVVLSFEVEVELGRELPSFKQMRLDDKWPILADTVRTLEGMSYSSTRRDEGTLRTEVVVDAYSRYRVRTILSVPHSEFDERSESGKDRIVDAVTQILERRYFDDSRPKDGEWAENAVKRAYGMLGSDDVRAGDTDDQLEDPEATLDTVRIGARTYINRNGKDPPSGG